MSDAIIKAHLAVADAERKLAEARAHLAALDPPTNDAERRLNEIEARLLAATKDPWFNAGYHGGDDHRLGGELVSHDLKAAVQALREVLEAGELTFSAKVESALVDVERAAEQQSMEPPSEEELRKQLYEAENRLLTASGWASTPHGWWRHKAHGTVMHHRALEIARR